MSGLGSVALRAAELAVRRGTGADAFELRVPALELRRGEVLAILGPNGAGKSTLLRALAGLEPPLGGRIEPLASGPITMVFQRPLALDGSVEHNVRLALLGLRLSRTEARRRVAESLSRFGIEHLGRRRGAGLSAGELRRLALARAFALQPSVLLLDEPFDDLDAAAQEALSLDLRRAIDATGVAVALVTHDLRRAALLADRMAVLIAGRLRQLDVRDHVLRRPESPEVARLVGMTNLIPGIVRGPSGGASTRIEVDAGTAFELDVALAPGTEVWVGIRAEGLKLDGGGGGLALGKARVQQLVSDGVLCTLRLDWAGHLLETYLISGRGLARVLAPGDTVSVSVRAEDVHILPRDGRG